MFIQSCAYYQCYNAVYADYLGTRYRTGMNLDIRVREECLQTCLEFLLWGLVRMSGSSHKTRVGLLWERN